MVSYHRVSVVIPNVGEKSLQEVIKNLNNGSIKPEEIILVVPKNKYEMILNMSLDKNTRILISDIASQVAQRILGFKNVRNELVMQLDADIIFQRDTLEKLVSCYNSLNSNVAIGPYFKKKNIPSVNKFKNLIFSYFISREINKVTYDSWFYNDDKHNDKEIFKTRWLPGGCILFNKKNLIIQNYYNFKGKAYDEDLLHSVILRNNNVDLYHCGDAHCYSLYDIYDHKNFKSLLGYLLRVLIVKNKVRILGRGSLLIFVMWYFYWFNGEMIRYFKSRFI